MRKLFLCASAVLGFAIISPDESHAKCRDVIDIYYTKKGESLAYDLNCPYTKTEVQCDNCDNLYVSRKHYGRWAQRYTELGMNPPHPQRNDVDGILQPGYN